MYPGSIYPGYHLLSVLLIQDSKGSTYPGFHLNITVVFYLSMILSLNGSTYLRFHLSLFLPIHGFSLIHGSVYASHGSTNQFSNYLWFYFPRFRFHLSRVLILLLVHAFLSRACFVCIHGDGSTYPWFHLSMVKVPYAHSSIYL